MKGLICAGGTATRLEELTRVTNKHLLPVGRWPMVYYPLQLLQRAGVREVLLVTGQQHAGQFIDLLGNGRVHSRNGDELLFDLDLSYKVQVEPGGIAQVVGMARDFAAGDQLVVCLGDNIFEQSQAVVAALAPADIRGAYMGIFGSTWSIGWALTPFLGLEVRSAYGDATMWFCVAVLGVTAGILGLIAARRHDAEAQAVGSPA